MKKYLLIILVVVVILILQFAVLARNGKLLNYFDEIMGSTVVGNDYNYITTSSTPPTVNVLKGSMGSLGSVIITKDGAVGGKTTFYDATTTNALLRNHATTTIASFPTDTTEGTYVFDVTFNRGLIMETDTRVGTTTITFR
jgi:hypothetical protein